MNKLSKLNYKAELVGVSAILLMKINHHHARSSFALNLNWRYLTIEVFPADLEDAIKGIGLSICGESTSQFLIKLKY